MYERKNDDDYFELWALNYNFFQEYHNDDFKLKFIIPPYHYNKNICAQKGILTYFLQKTHLKNPVTIIPLDKRIDNFFQGLVSVNLLYRIKISYSCAKDAFRMLHRMNYNASNLFPGYAGVAQAIDEQKYLCQIF